LATPHEPDETDARFAEMERSFELRSAAMEERIKALEQNSATGHFRGLEAVVASAFAGRRA